ncbi:hypothetical protein Tco_1523150 [Tanacetum coccineum]
MRPNLGVLQIGIRARVIENQAPPSPDYVTGPEKPEQAPPLPEFVPEPVYPKFMPPEDDVHLAEEQPLPAIEEEPSGDEADDEDEDEDDEEEEHLALANSVSPPSVHRTTARISIPAQAPVPFLSEEEVERFLDIPTPPPSPLTPLSSPLPQIPSPPLPVSPPLPISPPPLPASLTYPLGFKAAMIRQRAEEDRPEVCLPPRKRLCIAQGPRYEVRELIFTLDAYPTRGFKKDRLWFCASFGWANLAHDPREDVGLVKKNKIKITDTWDEMRGLHNRPQRLIGM